MLKPGDIATALFTYSDQTGAKRRPVLVVSSEQYNTISGNVVIAAISSRPPRDRFVYMIEGWNFSGLKMPSKVRVGSLQTVSGVLLHKIGLISEEEFFKVKQLLLEILSPNTN